MHIKTLLGTWIRTAVCGCTLLAATWCGAQTASPAGAQPELKLYCVGYSHLDTQWRWSYPQVISEFLHNTLAENFQLFQKYPHYIFNFTGANRYMMFKEYYPQDYATLKKYIAEGRWFPAGSSMEEGDVNMPDGETIIRQVLYGNEFFRKEFGKASSEFMLPDCFGFQASLPSVLAHCGLKGFSTQKLTWGSAVGIPFNVGVWEGTDGRSVIAALNPGSYTSDIKEDLSHSESWRKRIEKEGKASGVYVDYHYYGAGDRGGSPHEDTVRMLEKSVTGNGPVHVISATAAQMFDDLTPQQVAKLPRYKGDLLLTNHSTGELSSEAYMKRCERKIEQLADAAERAGVAADWLGSAAYPMEKINDAWRYMLACQFHDSMAGTALPKCYEYNWNNEFLSMNEFAAVTQDGAGAVIRAMDTTSQGVPLVVFNPLTTDRQDVADATITVPDNFGDAVSVLGPDGKPVPAQIVSHDGNQLHLLFLAKAPSVGFAVYQVRPAATAERSSELSVNDHSLENARFKVTINSAGDIESIFDKKNDRQVLSAPARLAFLYENPSAYPAWNMDYDDRSRAPRGYVDGPAGFRVVEAGPVRVAIEITRQAEGSRFVQEVRLAAGDAGDRVEVASKIDWQTPQSSLEAVFPLTVSNPLATYESQSSAVQRGNNNPKKFEVPQQQWLDLTDTSGSYGTAILNDCKYGSDKPDDKTIRLTLLYTPGTRGGYEDQGSQDFGRQEMVYAIAPHEGGWQQAGTTVEAQRLNMPLYTFQSPSHEGSLGRSFSLCRIQGGGHVTAMAIKKAEDSDEIIIRLHETTGNPADGVSVRFPVAIDSAREVDGQEREIGPANVRDGRLVVNMTPFSLRAFAVKLAAPAAPLAGPVCQSLPLNYDIAAVSTHANLSGGSFDSQGRTFAAEAFPQKVTSEGITFDMGPNGDGQKNALACRGQSIPLPAGVNRVYVLAASAAGDLPCTFEIDGKPRKVTVQDWTGYIGQWDNRRWLGGVAALTYNWKNRLAGLVPGYVKPATVGWFCSHAHDPTAGNLYYQFTYLFKYGFDLPAGAKELKLPDNDQVRIFAITAASDANDAIAPAMPLYDNLKDHTASQSTDMAVFTPAGGKFDDTVSVSIQHPLYWVHRSLRYTLDGSQPTPDSPAYSGPLLIGRPTTIKAAEFDESNAAGPVSTAVFDVNDITPPTVTSVSGVTAASLVSVQFNKPVRKDQAETADNYHFQPPLAIQTAKLSDDGLGVSLILSKPMANGTEYHLTISGVSDRSPNANMVSSKSMAVSLDQPVYSLGDFKCDGQGMERRVRELPNKGSDPWTINFFVKTAQQPDDRTIIAGFGAANDDRADTGCGRYITKFSALHYWSKNADVDTEVPLDLNRWQMLSATYDGKTLVLFKNGKMIGQQPLDLSDDRDRTVRIAPLDAWDHTRRFRGEIRDFTIWRSALPGESLKAMSESMPAAD